ncbi:MAG: transporter substrate-binding domain-containing protein [Oscillospiraceae bacterium]|nr:transporter substrate-binding domain-containing protein [Oscillospiraceae bacterium]
MKDKIVRITSIALALAFVLAASAGCLPKSEDYFDISLVTSYRDIPGVTDEEIEAIDALRQTRGSFYCGSEYSTEAFILPDGTLAGFSALFYEFLSEFFDIPFVFELRQWDELMDGFNGKSVDFTNELTATIGRRLRYHMTTPIAERSLKAFKHDGLDMMINENNMSGVRAGFLTGTITAQSILDVYPGAGFEIVDVRNGEEAAEFLREGMIDVFIEEAVTRSYFSDYSDISSMDIFPLVYTPVSLATANPELAPVISVMNKYIAAGGIDKLHELYTQGEYEYAKYAFELTLSDEEKDYLGALKADEAKIPVAFENDNYPLSFWNEREGRFEGIALDVLAEISTLSGIEFEAKTEKDTRWSDMLEGLRSGEYAIISQLIKSDERKGVYLWAEPSYFTSNFAFLSKIDYPNLKMHQVVQSTVGIAADTAHEELYKKWFGNDANVIYYHDYHDMVIALESGEIDLALLSESMLLFFTHYHEMPGFKANVIVPSPLEESFFGLNINETELCSIISKAMPFVNTESIGDDWTSRLFDYSRQIVQARVVFMTISAILLLLMLVIVSIFFILNNQKKKTISKQAAELSVLLEKTKQLSEYELIKYTLTNKAVGVALWDKDIIADNLKNLNLFDRDSHFRWSQEIRDMLGYMDENDFPDKLHSWTDRIHPDDKEMTMKAVLAHLSDRTGKTPYDVEFRLMTKSGEFRHFHSFGGTQRDSSGAPLRIVGALQDITEEKKMQLKLKEATDKAIASSTQLEAVISNYPGLIYCVDKNETIILFNGIFLTRLGFVPERFCGKSLKDMHFDYMHSEIVSYIRKTFSEGPQEWKIQFRGMVLNAHTVPVLSDLGEAMFVVGSIDDITDLARLQNELQDALHKANEASRAKTDFLAKMSHEIRTPMNAIIGMTELALRERKPDFKNEHIFTVKQAASNLLAIINDILDFSKIEAGKMEIIPRDYSVSSLINDVVSIIRMRVVDSQIRLAVNLDRNIPHTLLGDETRIRQVILNVLNNAVKFTDKGFVCFTARGEFIDDDTVNIIFNVTDTGIGIKQENINKLFSDFTQFDLERNAVNEGVGLGLAITHSIVTAMGGKIGVASEYGKGSTFTVVLPQKYNTRKKLAEVENPEEKSALIFERREIYANSISYSLDNLGVRHTLVTNGTELYEKMEKGWYGHLFISFALFRKNEDTIKKFGKNTKTILLAEFGEAIPEKNVSILAMPVYCTYIADILNGISSNFSYAENNEIIAMFSAPDAKVLVVDDIHTNLKVAQGLLIPYNMSVDLCSSGPAAIEAVKAERYDLVFMDHKMPGMDGIEATRLIREMGKNDRYYKEVPIIALTANAVLGMMEMFLENGFNDFLSKPIDTVKLDALLGKWIPKSMQKALSSEAAAFAKENAGGENMHVIINGLDYQNGLARARGRTDVYAETLSVFCTDISEKLDKIEDCLLSGDLSLYTTYVHGIKGASAAIGAIELSGAAEALEAAGRRQDTAFINDYHGDFIKQLKAIIDNIKNAIKPEPEREETGYDKEAVNAGLLALKDALENLNAGEINRITENLKKSTRGQSVGADIRKIYGSVLVGDYDEAITLIDALRHGL